VESSLPPIRDLARFAQRLATVVIYATLDEAGRPLRRGPERIEVGQTADMFKARLGCRPTPRYFYVKGGRPAARAALARGFRLMFPDRPAVPSYAVFRR
jgi:hypothetical protein